MSPTTAASIRPVDVYVAERGNGFMADIAGWLADAAAVDGRAVRLITDALPTDPEPINLVVAPHELFVLADHSPADARRAAAISVPVATEQPHTPWFPISVQFCRPAALVLDINRHGVAGLRRTGIAAEHLQLGAVPSMRAPETARDLDVVFLGADTLHRQRRLAALAPTLASRRSELRLFRFDRPVTAATPGVITGAAKYATLARARVLVNIHRDPASAGYFEWARLVEAMANGCVVVTEPTTGHEPLVAGTHFVVAEGDELGPAIAALLDDPARWSAISAAGRAAVTEQFPLTTTLAPFLRRLDELGSGAVDDTAPERASRRRPVVRRSRRPPAPYPVALAPFQPFGAERRRIYDALLAERDLRREIDETRCLIRHGTADHVTEQATPAFLASDRPVPGVSAVVTLYNYAGVVTECLDSLLASTDVELEVIVVDDHSSDDGRAVVADYLERHGDVPMLLLGADANAGLEAARNRGIERTTANAVLIIDADNAVYPAALRRLSDVLGADPDAAFAYSMLEAFGAAPGLRSHLPWNVDWLCERNYIDAQALFRRSTFDRFGGYLFDPEVYGLEDWDLWLRIASGGGHGVHVPELLGRYRTQAGSMVSITALAEDDIRRRIAARYPELPWPPDLR